MNRFKITSTGRAFETLLIDKQTNQPVGYVQKITWSVDTEDQLPRCTIELLGVELDVEVDATVVKTGFVKHGVGPSKEALKEETSVTSSMDDASWQQLLKNIESNEINEPLPAAKPKKAKKKAK